MVYEIEIDDELLTIAKEHYLALYQLGWVFADNLRGEDMALLKSALCGIENDAQTMLDFLTDAVKTGAQRPTPPRA